jgi:hypothetical protein
MAQDPSPPTPPGTPISVERRVQIAARYRAIFARSSGGQAVRLQKADIERGFSLLNDILRRDGRRATVNLIGGAVMLLVHELRPKTLDVDGWLAPENYIEDQIREVGRVLGDERWLNEQDRMYLPDRHHTRGDWLPYQAYSNLVVQTADERTMFAMKALALRGAKDKLDFQYLAEILSIHNIDDAMGVMRAYYRESSITATMRLKIKEALDDLPA